MKQILVAICAALLVAGCGSKGGTQQPKASVEQRDLFEKKEKQQAEDAAKQARIQQEQEELKRQMDEQKRRQEEAARRAAEAEQAVVKPLPRERHDREVACPIRLHAEGPEQPAVQAQHLLRFRCLQHQGRISASGGSACANFCAEHKDYKVRIEGNCDERGSREYNLALGQRRADSVKRAMTLLGVPGQADRNRELRLGKAKVPLTTRTRGRRIGAATLVYVGVDNPPQ